MRNNLLTFPLDCAISKSSITNGAAPASEHHRHDATGVFDFGPSGPSFRQPRGSGRFRLGVDKTRAFFYARNRNSLKQMEV
jgi:hypothetical protein